MSTIPVVWLTLDDGVPARGYWDQGLLELAISGMLWRQQQGYEFEPMLQLPAAGGAIVIVPGGYHARRVDELNDMLTALEWSLVIVTSDEETKLEVDRLTAATVVWQMTPVPGGPMVAKRLGEGFEERTIDLLDHCAGEALERDLDVAFAGQVTHWRRDACAEAIDGLHPDLQVRKLETNGFTQGLEKLEYLRLMARAKVAPCPGGPATPDSFRVYEALEAHAVPIADEWPAKKGYPPGFWDEVMPGHPFPVIRDWAELQKYVDAILAEWPASANRSSSWWIAYKRALVAELHQTVGELSHLPVVESDDPSALVTVVMPTSPIQSHPETAMLEQVLDSVRHHLPAAEVIIAADGVRPEQEHLRSRYDEYLRRLLWLADHRYGNVLVQLHDEHQHQANITRTALEQVRTPLLLFVEHDTPVWPEPIDWPAIIRAIRSGRVDLVRFHHESHVLAVHQHLMLDSEPRDIEGAPLLRTVQWSQRPHLASAAFYRTLLAAHFPASGRTMIEDRMHGIVHNAWRVHGLAGWEQYRLAMYAPPGDIKRSGHLDGRDTEPKFEMVFE